MAQVGPLFSRGDQNFQEKMVRPDQYFGNFGPPNQFFQNFRDSATTVITLNLAMVPPTQHLVKLTTCKLSLVSTFLYTGGA